MKKLQIKKEIAVLQANSNGRVTYSTDIKKAIIATLGEFGSQSEMAEYYNISADRLSKWKRSIEGIVKARSVQHGTTGIRYSISTKIDACKQIVEYGKNINAVATAMGIAHSTISGWLSDYQEGKYTLDNVVQISRKKFRSFDVIIKDIEKKEQELSVLKDEAKKVLTLEYEEKMSKIGE